MKITAFKNSQVMALSLSLGLIFFGFNGAEQHFTSFYQQIGLSNLAFQSLAILYGSIILGNLFGPAIVRKIGVKRSFLLGYTTYVILVFGMVLKIKLLIYLLSFALGLGAGITGIARIEFLYLISPLKKRGEFAGAIESVRTLGGFLGVAGVSFLAVFLSLDQIFLLLGSVILLGVILLFNLKSLKKPGLKLEDKNWKLMVKLMRSPQILLLLPYHISGGLLLGLILGAVPAAIAKNFGIGWVGIITSIFHLTLAAVLLLAGYLSDIKGRFLLIYGSVLVEILGSFLFLNSTSLIFYAVVMVLLGLGQSLAGGAFSALMLDTFEDKVKEASAILGSLGIILGIVPSFLLPQSFETNQLFIFAILISLAGIAGLYIFQTRYSTKVV